MEPGNTTDAKGDRLLKDYSPAEIGSFGNPVESAQGGPADLHQPGGGTSEDSTGGEGQGNQNEPHDVMPDEVPFYGSLGEPFNLTIQQGYVFVKKTLTGADALETLVVDMTASDDEPRDPLWCVGWS